ncbi:MAG: leucine-rich repeat domain-containing protein [Oscillospiraceae bacterium]|nr:leucine-rich repeat domain-containing protein [Oscillospiraceae bacterium]
MKKILSLIIALSLCSALPSVGAAVRDDNIIRNDKKGMPDKSLYTLVLQHLGKDKGETFTKAEAAGLIGLYEHNSLFPHDPTRKKIKNLRGLEHFSGLKDLSLSNNSIKSLLPIKKLRNLEGLDVEENKLTNLKGIENLTKLTELNVAANKLTGVSEVKKLTKLKRLDANRNKITSFSGIEKLINLKSLHLGENRLTNLNGIKALTKLTSLSVYENNLTSVAGIENLTDLEILDLYFNNLKRLPNMRKLVKLDGHEDANWLIFNRLSKKEFKKLPLQLVRGENRVMSEWLDRQIKYQNISSELTLKTSAKKITTKTRKITGKAHKNMSVRLTCGKKTIETVKANSKGKFTFNKLDLKKYRGKKLKIQAFHKRYGWTSKTVTTSKIKT